MEWVPGFAITERMVGPTQHYVFEDFALLQTGGAPITDVVLSVYSNRYMEPFPNMIGPGWVMVSSPEQQLFEFTYLVPFAMGAPTTALDIDFTRSFSGGDVPEFALTAQGMSNGSPVYATPITPTVA